MLSFSLTTGGKSEGLDSYVLYLQDYGRKAAAFLDTFGIFKCKKKRKIESVFSGLLHQRNADITDVSVLEMFL